MADQDSLQGMIPSASPIASLGIDPDELLASGDPQGYIAAKRAGVPYQPTVGQNGGSAPSAGDMSALAQAAGSGKPQSAVAPAATPAPATGTAAQQPPSPSVGHDDTSYYVTPDLKNPMEGFGTNLAQSQVPATNAPNPTAETDKTGAPAVPASITPSGTADKPGLPANPNNVHEGVVTSTVPGTPANAASSRGGATFSDLARNSLASATDQTDQAARLANSASRLNPTQIEAARVAAASPQSSQNPNGTPNPKDPNHPEFRPSIGRRIVRGVVGGLEGLGEGGLRGALVGAVDPARVGGTAYGAPTGKFSLAAQQAAGRITSLDQQLQQADTEAKTGDEATKTRLQIAAQYSGIGKDAAANLTAQNKTGTLDATLAKAGLKAVRDEHGNLQEIQDDPESEVYKGREALSNLRNAQQDLADAKSVLAKAQNDPNSPAFKLAVAKNKTAESNARAAQERASAYMLNATAGNLGTTPDGQQIEGSATSTSGRPIGSRFAIPYIKQEGKVAQFNDVVGATDNIEKTAENLVRAGGSLNSPRVATAIADPKSTSMQWAQGQFATSGLTAEERDYVTNVKAYKENLQALRQSAGGGVSDAQVNRLMEMAPGANTPDMDYLKRQTGQIRQTAGRLAEGVPSMKGGHHVDKPGVKPPGTPQGDDPFAKYGGKQRGGS